MKKTKKIKYYTNENGCWICTSHALSEGYPVIVRNYVKKKLSRVIYEKHKGKIPEDMLVRHTCDNPQCINPAHLILGTQADNMRDKAERDRAPKGEQHNRSTITKEVALAILNEADKSPTDLAEKYGVSYSIVIKILNRETWKHLKPGFRKKNKRKKLTKQQKDIIRRSKLSYRELAKRFGVSRSLIALVKGKSK